MISNNYIPEKINDFNTYLDGTKMIGVAASVTLPEVKMKTSTVSGAGINGEIDSPTIGQFESMEQEIDFNVLYSSAMDLSGVPECSAVCLAERDRRVYEVQRQHRRRQQRSQLCDEYIGQNLAAVGV